MALSEEKRLEIRQKAEKLLLSAGNSLPVKLGSVAEHLGYKVTAFVPDKETENISGAVNQNDKIIFVNSAEGSGRRRFTLAHEIGHVVLHPGPVVDLRETEGSKEPKEKEADYFAACLLMPETEFTRYPDWMTLSCGVNDVWHGDRGIDLETYKTNITSIVDQATKAGIKVVILEATMIGEDPANPNNQKLIAYNQFLHTLATEKHLPIADLNADMQAELAKEKAALPNLKGNFLTKDGVHPNGIGHETMAAGVLKAFGFTDAQVAAAKEKWLDLPNGAPVQVNITVRQYEQLRAAATTEGKSIDQLVSDDVTKAVQAQPGAPAPAPTTP